MSPTFREAFCDYFTGAPMLIRLNLALLAMLLIMLPFLPSGSPSQTIALFTIIPLALSITGLIVCRWYCDWGRVSNSSSSELD
jgi:uncharacterized membrane protein (DUF4010 family)